MEASGNHEGRSYDASVKDLAKHFKVHRNTVYNWLGSDDPPPHCRVGGIFRFNINEVEEWSRNRAAPAEVAS